MLIFFKGQREYFKFDVAAGELGDEFTAEQIGIGSGDEDGVAAVFAKAVKDRFKPFDVLDFIDEEIV